MKINKNDAERIRSDAWTAIDYIQAIMREAGNQDCFAPYILEKVKTAKKCLAFIEATAAEYMKEDKK